MGIWSKLFGRLNRVDGGEDREKNLRPAGQLLAIGYWDDASGGKWIMPSSLVCEGWRTEDRMRICDYLRRGTRIHDDLGYSYCRLSKAIPDSEMGSASMTDGYWAWPEGLVVYVEKFSVRLPSEFVEHVVFHDYKNAAPSREAMERLCFDYEFWEEWCKKQKGIEVSSPV